jgi:hypothetical protein
VREEGYEVEVTERYKSSSCAAGIPKTAITASPMNFSALRRPLAENSWADPTGALVVA